MKFRVHSGSLENSMKSCTEVKDRAELVSYLKSRSSLWNSVKEESINCEFYGFDERINWNTYILTDEHGVIGFTDGPI